MNKKFSKTRNGLMREHRAFSLVAIAIFSNLLLSLWRIKNVVAMKKIICFLMALMPFLFVSCGDSEGANENRAGIIAEDMVRADVLSPDDLDFNLVGVDEESSNEYHAVANIKTLNGLGMKVPRKVSVRLRYNGSGDWSDVNNWTKISISYLDEATGTVQ